MNNPRPIPNRIPPGSPGYINSSGVPQRIPPPRRPPRPDGRLDAARNTHSTINQLITRIVEGIGNERAGRTAFTQGLTQSIVAIQQSVNTIREKLRQLRARGDNVDGFIDILNAIQRRLAENADALDRGAVIEDPEHRNSIVALQQLIQQIDDDVNQMLAIAPDGNAGPGGPGAAPGAGAMAGMADAVGGLLGRMGARPEPRGGGRGLRRRKTRRLIRRVNRRKTRREKNKKNKKGGYKYTKTRRSTRSRSKSKTSTTSRKTNSRRKSKNYVSRFF